MRHSVLLGALLPGLAALAGVEPQGPAGPPQEPAPVIQLAVTPGRPEFRALKYTLLPDPLDLTHGNAAPLWMRAGERASNVQRDLFQGPNKVVAPVGTPLNPEGKQVALQDLPKDEIRSYLAHFSTTLRIADQAAHCDECDWELPPMTMQDFDFPLEDIQHMRTIAALLHTRFLLELSEKRFDDAIHTMQINFALARDVGKGQTLIQDLVGIAIGAITFGEVEQWEQVPGSPNLFWALTDLPAPIVDVGPAMRSELTPLYRSFPPLKEVLRTKGALSEEETNRIVAELFKDWSTLIGQDVPEWQRKLGAATLVLKTYPTAKKFLKDHGRTDEQLDAMPAAQVVLLYFAEQYDEIKDDYLKWLNVPPWQARPGLEEVGKKVRIIGPTGNPILLLLPAVEKVYGARVRIEYQADYLRCAEALRYYAMTHDGKPPASLADVKLPLPADPYTGEGFGKFYSVQADGTAVFEVPPPPNMPPLLGRCFVLK
ncbi:MAG TPA: hypothetical protein VMS17_12090 [Gemmataceae bacterium]|nr:hypothetical protein [Gemmataceae bacterium]